MASFKDVAEYMEARDGHHRAAAEVSSSFTTKRINATTFVIREDDAYEEHPLIYAKLHPKAPVVVLSDTGCDEPSEKHKHDRYIHLREYLERCPIPDYDDKPLNPDGKLRYFIICTHCHYDHTLGIPQFLAGGATEIIASAAGRDFIESDLDKHGIFKYIGLPTPYYQVTKWAQAFERLEYPIVHDWDASKTMPHQCGMHLHWMQGGKRYPHGSEQLRRSARLCQAAMHPSLDLDPHRELPKFGPSPNAGLSAYDLIENFDFDSFLDNPLTTAIKPAKIDLAITIIQTPGHTPDELAWYDHEEMHLYVGDSFYHEGKGDNMPIIFPGEGSLIEWVFSMQKLAVFVRGENARAAAASDDSSTQDADDEWVHVKPAPRRVKICCAHQTYSVDGAEILAELEAFSFRVFIGKVPVVASKKWHDDEIYDSWRESGKDATPMSIFAPRRLMEEARKFFGHDVAGGLEPQAI
ncbi:hypothetical protein LTR97_002354 [Elasticomyces elasticus]|uniref:Metallo-beta-lactamase domain-containing protein n=1 Tax=Elasticomyces elasticus TaxID=574655 RepID=A0AAN8A4N9_9PEZI|nr:hypothetical protein LTR97_002354 [Elasticomyces elasticus]